MAANKEDLNFDPDLLRDKYREERDKRLRQDGNEQYQQVEGDFTYFVEDPYVDKKIEREAIEDEIEVAIIGGGFGGILAAARLKESGIDNFKIFEKGGDFGGTWYWNRYPGASCDIESYIYFPLLEQTKFIPKQKYTNAPETLEYIGVIAKKYGLKERAIFQTEITKVSWSDEKKLWNISTNKGDSINAKFVVHSNGPLNRPKLPAIKGIDKYQGHTFHTSRWDYKFTGGNSKGNLNGLKDKKVAIIGTGATAVQCIPHLGEAAQELFVFQRTPSSIDERNNKDTDENWFESLKPGWHEKRRENFEGFLTGSLQKEDLVNDGWTEIFRTILGSIRNSAPSKLRFAYWAASAIFSKNFYRLGFKDFMMEKFVNYVGKENLSNQVEMVDFAKMEKIRARANEVVKDPETAESLKPYYRQFCKRPCFHDEYLKTYNRENVTLIDTNGKGLEKITEKGIYFDGKEYEVDCIIFATGFEVGTDYTRRSGYEIYGKQGLTLSEKWKDGLSSLHGMHCRGFPNTFFFGPAQGGFTANYTHSLDEQSIHLSYILKTMKEKKLNVVEASQESEEKWVETIINKARDMQAFQESCTPGYYNNEGKLNTAPQNNVYGGGSLEFFKIMNKWRKKGKLEGLEMQGDIS
ncbi:NAD(P)/FAD-dependent oxidoreductase [SAR86 cluster bacterium]|nr:NAD(P)/FAD-dependent oxidoreductase [SAR86 cluster bacterium]